MEDGALRILDLFCGAGGAAMGYHRSGFDVVGIDINPQPNYPFEFHQADAMNYPLSGFDVIHASPPCQAFSAMRKGRWQERQHPDLVNQIRQRLINNGKPYIIENVPGSPLIDPLILCGTMFNLSTKHGSQLRRHRLFEVSCSIPFLLPSCNHKKGSSVIGVYGGGQHPQRRKIPSTIGVYGHSLDFNCFTTQDRRDAMGIDWMTGKELSQSIPPAYTEWIGRKLIEILEDGKCHN
jgi:DNA (cytosine-5)-methyltransferase 1